MALFLGLVSVAHAQATTPTVSSVAVTSNPGTDNTYAQGNTITVTLTFSEVVTVDTTNGTPYVTIDIDGQPRNAAYSGDGSSSAACPGGQDRRNTLKSDGDPPHHCVSHAAPPNNLGTNRPAPGGREQSC